MLAFLTGDATQVGVIVECYGSDQHCVVTQGLISVNCTFTVQHVNVIQIALHVKVVAGTITHLQSKYLVSRGLCQHTMY